MNEMHPSTSLVDNSRASEAKSANQAPILCISFARTGDSGAFRRDGWAGQEAEAVWTAGPRSTLVLPSLPAGRTHILDLDVEPCLALPLVKAQLLRVSVNGRQIGWTRVSGSSQIACRIAPDMTKPGAPVEVTFEHPCFIRLDLLGRKQENRPLAIRFFNVRLYDEASAAAADQVAPLRRGLKPVMLSTAEASPAAEPVPAELGKPVKHEFGVGKPGERFLREGWQPDADGLFWTAAQVSHVELPPLPGPGSPGTGVRRLRLDLTPVIVEHRLPSQRMAVILDGLLLGQFRLKGETALSVQLPAEIGGDGRTVPLTLVLPDAMPTRGFANGGPEQAFGVALESIAIEPAPPRLRQAAEQRGDGLVDPPPVAVSARFLDLDAEALRDAIQAELGVKQAELMAGFESMGDNCAFGLAQRKAGAEPLGLLRFANTPLRSLLRGLADGFKAATVAADVELYLDDSKPREYMLRIARYGIRWHTTIHEPDTGADAGAVANEQKVKLSFLRRKFQEGLKTARKVYTLVRHEPVRVEVVMAPPGAPDKAVGHLQLAPVWDPPKAYEASPGPLCAAEAMTVLLELNRSGPATLLYFVPCTDGRRAGTVELLAPGLMRGYMASFVMLTARDDPNDLDWIRVAANAWALIRAEKAGLRGRAAA
jgi:hypothetical protein